LQPLPPFVCLPPAVLAGEVVRSEMISSDRLNNSTGSDDLTHDFSQNPEGELLWEHSTSAKASISPEGSVDQTGHPTCRKYNSEYSHPQNVGCGRVRMKPGPTVPIQARPFGLGGRGSSAVFHGSSPDLASLDFSCIVPV